MSGLRGNNGFDNAWEELREFDFGAKGKGQSGKSRGKWGSFYVY